MDIYDGLDFNPSSTTGNWIHFRMMLYLVSYMFVKKSSTPFGFTVKPSLESSQLKESMDLYEEIVTEEQQSRESTYSEVNHCVLHAYPDSGRLSYLSKGLPKVFVKIFWMLCFISRN